MIKLAIIGCGYWGMNLVRNIVESDKVSLVLACDHSPKAMERIRSRYPSIEVCQDAEKVFKNKEIQGIVIATDPESHFSLAQKAILSGKDVLLEKPMTTSAKTSADLIELAEKHKRVLMVGHTFEYSPPVIKGEEIIKDQLGEIIYASFSRMNLGLYREKLSVLWDLAPHDFSIIYKWFKKMPIGISCFANSFMLSNNVPDIAFMRLFFDTQMIVNVELSWVFPLKTRKIVVIGKERMMIVDESVPDEKLKIYNKGVEMKNSSYDEYKLIYRSGDVISPFVETYEPLRKEVEHFADCIGTRARPLTDGESGLRIVRMIEAAEKSYEDNGRMIKP